MELIEHHLAELSNSTVHYVTAGEGTPLVLLHGWPQTWYCWRRVIPLLASKYRIIAPDLPGLGESVSKSGRFDKRSIAAEIVELTSKHLELDGYHLVGHDWGGGVAWAVAAHYPGNAKTLTLVDIAIPGDGSPNISQGGARWHHGFHNTDSLPEELITGREDIYLGWFYRNYGASKDAINSAEMEEYLRSYRRASVLHAGFELYRAVAQDVKENAARASVYRPPIPVLAIGGGESWGRGAQVGESARRMADDVTEEIIEGAGHWIPEEQPEALANLIDRFCMRR
ncbi:alpha/beta hydrolase [Burkholderia anthina]|uniref:alpha/beta fold hydrolase n=1 Tax=Burkholderia anthina TaxID=179879 RepID=UPI00158993D9|nr:alpha/beta hydrolase [Burkholderia anthina]MBY4867677.1 alpha/beta hydrolase [Burkholderia anthina]